jgi:hypothetical protein
MDEKKLKALEWYKKAEHDIESVKILIHQSGTPDLDMRHLSKQKRR